jgi:acetyl esterase/lipase
MKQRICAAAVLALLVPLAGAQTSPQGSRELPARSVPVPETVSPQMQKLIGAPLTPTWNVIPKSAEEWKAQVNAGYEATMKSLPALREALGVKVEPITLDGVKAYMVTPSSIPPQNRNRLLVHVHGGCFVSFPGESGTAEAVYMAGIGGFRVISVDYRMPPDHPYPAALDDAITAWKAATRMASPKNMAIFGSSAGGNLTLAMVLRAKQDKLPLPAAIAPGTPMADLTNAGDSFQTNAMLDNVLVARCELRQARRALHRRPRSEGSAALAGVRRPARLSAGHSDHRDARPPAQQHGAGAPQAQASRGRSGASGLRRPVARPLLPRRERAGNA